MCYYFFGLPLAIYLGFTKNLELVGFWLGFTIALVLLDIIVGVIVIRSDWSAKSFNDDHTDATIVRSLKITRQNSMFAASPLLPSEESPSKIRRANSNSSSRVRKRKSLVQDDFFERQP